MALNHSLLAKKAIQEWQTFLTACDKHAINLPDNPEFITATQRVFSLSDFVAHYFIKQPDKFLQFIQNNELAINKNKIIYQQLFSEQLADIKDETEFIKKLRQFRQYEMVRIAWRDLTGIATLQETVAELSYFADVVLEQTATIIQQWQYQRFKLAAEDIGQELVIIAVGKLGATELNFSSDIDLIFVYDHDGETDNGKSVEYQRFFLLVAQQLIKVLSLVTEDGFVFRVDMRLRPFGSSGPLVISSNSLKNYYEQNARDWERYALSRGRIISGDTYSIHKIKKIISDFVYKPYLDYSVTESLRQMKQLIKRETHGLEDDIKRGDGGIREIEFVVQIIQLIRGGKDLYLQQTSILELLPLMAAKKLLANQTAYDLLEAYEFLRKVEHYLQEVSDKQTQKIPNDELAQAQLMAAMKFKDWESFAEELEKYRHKVQTYFNATVAKPKVSQRLKEKNLDQAVVNFVAGQITEQQAHDVLSKIGFQPIDPIIKVFNDFRLRDSYQLASESRKQVLHYLLSQWLLLLVGAQNILPTLKLLFELAEVIATQSSYIDLLLENPNTWLPLIALYDASPWLASQMNLYPFLLEELLDKQTLYSPYSISKLDDELRQYLLAMPEEDLDLQMEYLRHFKLIQVLRVASADIKGILPLMKVSDHLTFTASAILKYVQSIAWKALAIRHGHPCQQGQALSPEDFAIIGYGKLGGIELSYASDLDLVFLYPNVDVTELTDGVKPISNSEFFIRLAQKIIHILNAATKTGILYEVDTRLRPSGNSGLLAISMQAFKDYQLKAAWTWEHQALVRARCISGSSKLKQQFEAIRQEVLTQQRVPKQLANEVSTMREKLRDSFEKKITNYFDVKQGRGGVKDIEFLVQFIVLNHAHEFPALIEYTDNIRILESVGIADILAKEVVEELCDAYRVFRGIVHRASLKNAAVMTQSNEINHFKDVINDLWQQYLS